MKRILALLFSLLLLLQTIDPSVYAAGETTGIVAATSAEERSTDTSTNVASDRQAADDIASSNELAQSDTHLSPSTVNEAVYTTIPPVLPQEEEQKYIVRLTDNHEQQSNQPIAAELEDAVKLPLVDRYSAELTPSDVNDLIRDGAVQSVELDQPIELAASKMQETDLQNEAQQIPWGLYAIGANLIHASNTAKKVKVAVLDTGVSSHSDLNITGGVSFVEGEPDYNDQQGHGTHMAGTISAIDDTYGIVGVAPNVDLYAVKVINAEGKGYTSSVIQAIDWAIDHQIDIINISFTSVEYSDSLEKAIQTARDKGLLLFAAAGNSGNGSDNVRYPAKYPGVIGVGAVNTAHQRATFSATGDGVDLVAPGTNVLSTLTNNKYGVLSGTSSATAFASGAAALLWGQHPDWTSRQVEDQMLDTATSLGESAQYGKGLINIAKALGKIDGSIAPLTDGEDPSLITLPTEPVEVPPVPGDLELASYAHVGNNQTINAGDVAKVSLKLQGGLNGENVHPRVTITVAPANDPTSVLTPYTKVVMDPDLDVEIPFEWKTATDTTPGVYTIKYAYRAFADGSMDDTFKITVLPASGEVQDTYEPNNTVATAKVVQEGESYISYIPTSDDVDYYTFTATTTRTAKIQLYSSRAASYSITAYTDSQSPLASATSANGDTGELSLSVEAGKTYNLKIVGSNGYFGSAAYTLSIDGYVASGLAAPTKLITVPNYNSVKLTWDMMSDATAYIVQVNGKTVATITDNVFKVVGLSSLTSYTFGVAAVYPTGTSKFTTARDTTLISELIINVPQDSKLTAGAEQLFTFKPATTGIYHIYTGSYLNNGKQSFTDLKIFNDAAQSSLVADGQDAVGTSFAEIKAPLTGGKTYYVRLSGFDRLPMEARITAKVISSDIPYIALNEAKDIDENKDNSTLYIFVPGATANYKLLTSYHGGQSGKANNTRIQVYQDAGLKSLITGGEADDSSTSGFSKLEINLDKGVPYYVKVSAYDKVYARLFVTAGAINYTPLQARQATDVSVRADQQVYYSFTPAQTGKYRLFTATPGGTSRTIDPYIYLYSDPTRTNLIGENDNAEGSNKYYGSLDSKLETELQAGKTYYLTVENDAVGKAMTIRLQVEDAFQSTKATAQRVDWDQIYEADSLNQKLSTSSLYDVDFYRFSLSSTSQVNINLYDNFAYIENQNNRLYGFVRTDDVGGRVFTLPAGEYYLRVDSTLTGVASAQILANKEYTMSLYINEINIDTDGDTDSFETSSIPANAGTGAGIFYSFTPNAQGERRSQAVFKYPNKLGFSKIVYKIYPNQFAGSYTEDYTVFQSSRNHVSAIASVDLKWDGSVAERLRTDLSWKYNGAYYAKDGLYQIASYPYPLTEAERAKIIKGQVKYQEIYVQNSVSFNQITGNHYYPPPFTLDGTKNSDLVRAGMYNECDKCKEYYRQYVVQAHEVGHSNWYAEYVTWFKNNYGTTSLQKFFDGADKLISPDPNATLSEMIHSALFAGELIPVISVGAGGVDSIMYLSEGEYTEASLSAAGMIPFGASIKVSYRTVKAGGEIVRVTKEVNIAGIARADEVAKYAKKTCNCFVAGTKIQTIHGEEPIEDIKIGDQVLSKNAETGQKDYKIVTALYRNEKETTYKLHVNNEVIETTDNHPFWVEGKGWVTAIDLKVGDPLKQSNGHVLAIEQIEVVHHEQKVKVYNFTVAEYHTYFVSDLGIWVHNLNCSILDWSMVSKRGETRWDHVQSHTHPKPERDTHGVFNGKPVATLNEAWNIIQEKGIQPYMLRAGADLYKVEMKNVGVGGGRLDDGKIMNHIEIVVLQGTNKIITGYPVE